LWKLAADFRQRTGIEADIVLTGLVGSLPIEVAQTLYAAACESLRNVERHSNARAVILGLNISPETVTLSIQDDGTVASVLSRDHGLNTGTSFGLRRVGQRVRDLHGSFVAGRNPDSGFQVRARLPLSLNAPLGASHL
jgi:signal transduction histidine kinase